MDIGFRTTKTVWVFPQIEACGIPSYSSEFDTITPTLADEDYALYCDILYKNGYEIASHGASAGNNTRERIVESMSVLRERYGGTETYIQHSKNADNLYYEEKVAPDAFLRWLVSFYSRNVCSGEEPGSKYYWGDYSKEYVKQIRLFRTRYTNTLKVNPSMPYYDPKKPCVNGWFTATRRAFHHCATEQALARLKRKNGLTVLYQYLTMYVGDDGTISEDFIEAAQRLLRDGQIWVAPTRDIMHRLRSIQGLYVVHKGKRVWIVNTNSDEVKQLQIKCKATFHSNEVDIQPCAEGATIDCIPAQSVVKLHASEPLRFVGKRTKRAYSDGLVTFRDDFGSLVVNIGDSTVLLNEKTSLAPKSYVFKNDSSVNNDIQRSKPGVLEHYTMFFHQMWIIVRQMLFLGRSWNTKRYSRKKSTKIHSHYYW